MSRRRSPDLLVEAAGRLRKKGTDVGLVFCGSGEMEPELKRRCSELGLPAVFLGFVNQSGLSAVYHACDLFCLPSREGETWGLVVNEALLHGLPVVVSEAVGCAPDLVARHECGENFQTGRVEALAVGLKSSIQRGFGPEWRAGCRKVVEPYSTKKAAEGICRTLK